MADKTFSEQNFNTGESVSTPYMSTGSGDFPIVSHTRDLSIGTKSVALTLSTGAGSVVIPDNATFVGVCPVSSTAIRVGLEAPEADGTKTGDAVLTDCKKGLPVLAAIWAWFYIGTGTSRKLYVKGGTSDVVEVCFTGMM